MEYGEKREKLLKAMIRFATAQHALNYCDVLSTGKQNVAIKPGVADRLLFNRILDGFDDSEIDFNDRYDIREAGANLVLGGFFDRYSPQDGARRKIS